MAVELAYPSWFVTPSPFKDDGALMGGQRQVRPSCKKPAAQTWPLEITECETSRWPDGTTLSLDIDQAELRTVGLLSGEPSILAAYAPGSKVDLHSDRAIAVFGYEHLLSVCGFPLNKSNDRFKEPYRYTGKTANFSDAYKCGPNKLWSIFVREAKFYVPYQKAVEIVNSRKTLRPVLCSWQEELLDRCRVEGSLTLPLIGVSRSFYIAPKGVRGEDKDDTCEACNFPVQAIAAAAVLDAQRHLSKHLPRGPSAPVRMYKQVYDSLAFDSRRFFVPELKQHIANAIRWSETNGIWGYLQANLGRSVPLKYDISEDI